MPLIDDPRYTGEAQIGQLRTDLLAALDPTEPPAPATFDVLAAAARQSLPGAAYERFANRDPDNTDDGPDFDPLDHISGFEPDAPKFVGATSRSEVEGIKTRLRAERADRETLSRAGVGGVAAEIGFTVFDPSFLAAAAVPQLGIARAYRAGRALQAGVEGVAVASAYEAGMQSLQEDRSARQSAISIAAGGVLGAALGSIGRRVPVDEIDATRALAADELQRSEVGAAAVVRPTTLAAESVARGGRTVSDFLANVPLVGTDLQRILASRSTSAHTALQELADVAPMLEKNLEGVATPASVESVVIRHEGRVATFATELKRLWSDYRASASGETRMTREQFESAIAGAARRGDESAIPQVAEGARLLRSTIFDPLKQEAQRLKLLPEDVHVVGAESYFRRMYDREMIRRHRREWDAIITRYFYRMGREQGVELAEARAAAEDVTRNILGGDVGQANFIVRAMVPEAGPLKERVLAIDDAEIERFLVNDPVRVAAAYVRELAPQIEITRRFGDRDMRDALQRIREDYEFVRERIRTADRTDAASAELTKLEAEERETLEALVRVRDRIYGRAGRLTPDSGESTRRAVQAARGWRNIVAAGRLGGTALTAGAQDLHRIVAQYGYARTFAKLGHLVASPAFRELSKANARRLGAATEVALSRRVHAAADGAITEGWTQRLAEGVYRYSGLNHLTDFYRTLAATLFEDEVLRVAAKVSRGEAVAPHALARLASLGLDRTALRGIHAEVRANGGKVDAGLRVSGSADWTDARLADLYDAAVLKESRILVMEPGAADRVWWMDSELGRVVGQIKSFSLAAPGRLATYPLQLVGQRQYVQAARFAGTMMVGGYLAYALRNLAAGKEVTTDPRDAAGQALVESGLLGILPDLASPIGRRLGLGEAARYADSNAASVLGGPALGTFQDAWEWAFTRSANGVSASDLHMARRLLPFQNLWWMRRAINALEGETAEALELKGADASTFGERMLQTDPLLPAGERGATGTGRPSL